MGYPDYLVHFNRIHDPKTGKFSWGDGDGDGIRNDHANAIHKPGSNSSNNRGEQHSTTRSEISRRVNQRNATKSGMSTMMKNRQAKLTDLTTKGKDAVDAKSEASIRSFGGGGVLDPETEEEKRRRLRNIRIEGELADEWIDGIADADRKMWDVAYGTRGTQVVYNKDGTVKTYVDSDGYTRAVTKKTVDSSLSNWKTNRSRKVNATGNSLRNQKH